jgi:uncharacterized cofD-like protein
MAALERLRRAPDPPGRGPRVTVPAHRSQVQVAALGGGHGLAMTLAALRQLGVEPTAIVTVADDGGSSGRLRRELGVLPPGDLRMALLALAGGDTLASALFAYRFRAGDLAGHSLGNLVLAALTELEGGFLEALAAASRLLDVRGQVLPSTLETVSLHGTVAGDDVRGQAALGRAASRIDAVWLEPRHPAAVPAAVAAVEQADLVLLGPGSTFTSVVPNLLVPELGACVAAASDRIVYVCNLEPQVGETTGFTPTAHVRVMLAHCPGLRVPRVLCQRPTDTEQAGREVAALAELGAEVVHADVADERQRGRHDPQRLAAALKTFV